jgi:uncharacterized protein (DUF2141 family)
MEVIVKIRPFLAALGVLLSAARGALAADAVGGDVEACQPGARGAALLVTVVGFKDRAGRLRVQTYADKAEDWLVSGKYLHRVESGVSPAGDMTVCLALAAPGRYALVVLHDRDEDGRLSVWSDGVGFSNNPALGHSKPKIETVAFTARPGVTPMRVVLNYRRGLLSVGPLAR